MKKQNNIVLLTALVIFNLIFTNCEKTSKSIQTDKLENFHIKSIGKELELLSKAMIPVIQNKRNVEIIKEAIYQKKRDENITLKDLFNFHNGLITKPGFGNERVISLEQQILDNINQYQAMTLDELRSLIETYDMSLYWEFIQLWDGTTQPLVGYPTNEEEDVNNDYDLMSYKIFTSTEDVTGVAAIRSYIKDNPVILIRPLENFENGGEAYYGDVDYVWLGDLDSIMEINKINDVNRQGNLKTTQNLDRCRLYAINTNGRSFDGSGGPEFRFWRVGTETFINIIIPSFSEIVEFNLTSSAAATTSWIYPRNTVDDILDDLWLVFKWRQTFGCYEQDGGLDNKQLVNGYVLTATILEVVTGQVEFGAFIDRRDDKIYQHNLSFSSYVNNVKGRQAFLTSWGKLDNWPIHFTDHPDLKIAYSNL